MLRLIAARSKAGVPLKSSLQQAVPMTTKAGVGENWGFPLIGSALEGMALPLYVSDPNILTQGLQKECTFFLTNRD